MQFNVWSFWFASGTIIVFAELCRKLIYREFKKEKKDDELTKLAFCLIGGPIVLGYTLWANYQYGSRKGMLLTVLIIAISLAFGFLF